MTGLPIPTESRFQQYAQALASTVFADKKFITGQELITALPEKQINLLILFRLKEKWEDEASAITSPYFNYDAVAVREAQKKFLNLLSQHIQLDQETYTDFVTRAIQDAWQLASKPSHFLTALAEKMANPSITVDQVQSAAKYIVYHGDMLREALKDMTLTGRSSFLKGDFYQQLQRIEDRLPEQAREKHFHELTYFLSTLGISEDEPMHETPTVVEPEPIEVEFFSTLEASLEEDNFEENKAIFPEEPTPLVVDTVHESSWPVAEEPSVPVATEVLVEVPEPVIDDSVQEITQDRFVPDWNAPSEETPSSTFAPPEKKTFDLFSQPTEDKEESLGERLAKQNQSQGLYAKVAAANSENLHSIIAIGDRYMIVGQLFGNDMAGYSLAVSHLNGLSTYEEAVHYLWDEIASKHSWNPESEAYKTLDSAMRRKFSA